MQDTPLEWQSWLESQPPDLTFIDSASLRRKVRVLCALVAFWVIGLCGARLAALPWDSPTPSEAEVLTPFSATLKLFRERTRGCVYSYHSVYRQSGLQWMVCGRPHSLLKRLRSKSSAKIYVLVGGGHTLSVFECEQIPKTPAEAEREGRQLIRRTFQSCLSLSNYGQDAYGYVPKSFDFTTRLHLRLQLIDWPSLYRSHRVIKETGDLENQDAFEAVPEPFDRATISFEVSRVPFALFAKADRVEVSTTWTILGGNCYHKMETMDLKDWPTRAACKPPLQLIKDFEKEDSQRRAELSLELKRNTVFLVFAGGYLLSLYRRSRAQKKPQEAPWPGVLRSRC